MFGGFKRRVLHGFFHRPVIDELLTKQCSLQALSVMEGSPLATTELSERSVGHCRTRLCSQPLHCDQSMKVASGEASIVLAWLTSLISNRPLSKRVALPSAVSSNLFKSLALMIVFRPLSVPLMVSFSVTSCE